MGNFSITLGNRLMPAVAHRGAFMSGIVNFGKYVFRVFGVKKFKMFEGIARVF